MSSLRLVYIVINSQEQVIIFLYNVLIFNFLYSLILLLSVTFSSLYTFGSSLRYAFY